MLIILFLFGAKQLPELSREIANSVKEVRKGFRDDPSEPKAAAVAPSDAHHKA